MISSTLATSLHGGLGQTRLDETQRPNPTNSEQENRGFHVAVIMDGNGRWAQRRGRPRRAGHVAGAAAVRRAVQAAPGLGISTLTLYAFSADNWKRPKAEVDHLMRLFRSHLRSECTHCLKNGVRISIIGRRDRLPSGLVATIEDVEAETAPGTVLHVRIAIDYSARDALRVAAAASTPDRPLSREEFGSALARAIHAPAGTKDVDLLIRTGGERRLSDFLLWESAYAELLFTAKEWPDFTAADLESALGEFSVRQRRFGALPEDGAMEPTRAVRGEEGNRG